ncbi:MAG: BrnT family toxin [Steroidobacteraceae bacterium]
MVGHPFRLPLGLLPLHDVATMIFEWDERKRRANLRKHGIDLADAPRIFSGYTWTVEDVLAYGEQRFQTFGVLDAVVVAVCHTIMEEAIRLISVRKATKHEAQDYFAQIPD